MHRKLLIAPFTITCAFIALVLARTVSADAHPHRYDGKEYDAARNITTCIYRRLGESSPEKIRRREIRGKVACPTRYYWDDSIQYPDEEGTYLLNEREFDSENNQTVCLFREVGGTKFRKKILSGDTDCPTVFY